MSNTTRLADLRPTVASIAEADSLHARIARLTCDLAVADARIERAITLLKAKHADATAAGRAELANLEKALLAFIDSNRAAFESPRQRKIDTGSYGLRTVSDVLVSDESAVIQRCLDAGYEDCVKTVRSPIKSGLKTHLADGESIPGCALRTGDTATYSVARALVDRAVEEAA